MPNHGNGEGDGQLLHAVLLLAVMGAGELPAIFRALSIPHNQRIPIALVTSSLAVVTACVLGLFKGPAVRPALAIGMIWLGMLAMLLFYLAPMFVGTAVFPLASAIVSASRMKTFKV